MTSRRHGAIIAAPTFGLPEVAGGARNWDYRYAWIRDAGFAVYALMRLGYTEEADAFMAWVQARALAERALGEGPPLQIMYGIDGRKELTEHTLAHFQGYGGARPVRIGNAAYDQLQLDIYGALLDAVYLSNKYGQPIGYDAWGTLSETVSWVCANWRRPDEGIWEFRGGKREFLHSRLMCWVAVDRAIRLAQKRSLPAPFAEWVETRGAIHHDIMDTFWDRDRQTFVQAAGSHALDASALLMPLVRFISPVDPRWISTLAAIEKELVSDCLVRRYDLHASREVDGLDGDEGSFTACSFWYVECLARAGRVADARLAFEKMLGFANHLGLFSEELGMAGEHLGNFPQVFTHLALISAAYALDRRLSDRPHQAWER
jgi:GH15 family glucan-1,4-alpha-glucosidase